MSEVYSGHWLEGQKRSRLEERGRCIIEGGMSGKASLRPNEVNGRAGESRGGVTNNQQIGSMSGYKTIDNQ